MMLLLPLLTIPARAAKKTDGLGPALTGPQVSVPRYGKFETSFQLADMSGNPFDPADNDVWAVFSGPKGQVTRVPAFWDGNSIWKVRFAPAEIGRYAMRIIRNGVPEHPEGLTYASLICTSSSDPGFIRRDPKIVQRFLFDNGSVYYPLGCDRAWQNGGEPSYPDFFGKMHAQGMNWTRIWMNPWDNKNLEWLPEAKNSPPIGQYSLDVARHWDEIVDSAADNGVYIQMTIQHHGEYTAKVDSNWRDNPFNVANGGFLKHPQDFFTDQRAIQLTKNKLRYIVARWGWSDHIMGWELFNEVQNIQEAPIDTVIAWHKQMAAYLRSIDPYHHLITTSYTPPDSPLEQQVPLDYDQEHSYVPDIISLFGSLDVPDFPRPIFWGEWGGTGKADEGFLHDGLWSGVMTPLAGGPQYWAWDAIDSNDWWPQFGAVTRYLSASGVLQYADLAKTEPAVETAARGDISFAPPGGWGATTSYLVTVSPSTGAQTGLAGVSTYIQGTSHRDMMSKPIEFDVNYPKAGQFILTIGQLSQAGAHPQILLDGIVAGEIDLPAGGNNGNPPWTLAIDVPAGQHQIGIFNTGPDWYTVQKITLTNYAPALGAAAKGDKETVFFWAYNRHRSYDNGPAAKPVPGKLTFSGLDDGAYAVTLWDTSKGVAVSHLNAPASGGTLPVSLPPFAGDIAGWAVKK